MIKAVLWTVAEAAALAAFIAALSFWLFWLGATA
jgi:hypothetical protein